MEYKKHYFGIDKIQCIFGPPTPVMFDDSSITICTRNIHSHFPTADYTIYINVDSVWTILMLNMPSLITVVHVPL